MVHGLKCDFPKEICRWEECALIQVWVLWKKNSQYSQIQKSWAILQTFKSWMVKFTLKRLVHVFRYFPTWDVMTKVRYFLTGQIYNLRTLKGWTCVLTLWGSEGSESWKWSIKRITYLRHYVPSTNIPDMNKSKIRHLAKFVFRSILSF